MALTRKLPVAEIQQSGRNFTLRLQPLPLRIWICATTEYWAGAWLKLGRSTGLKTAVCQARSEKMRYSRPLEYRIYTV